MLTKFSIYFYLLFETAIKSLNDKLLELLFITLSTIKTRNAT